MAPTKRWNVICLKFLIFSLFCQINKSIFFWIINWGLYTSLKRQTKMCHSGPLSGRSTVRIIFPDIFNAVDEMTWKLKLWHALRISPCSVGHWEWPHCPALSQCTNSLSISISTTEKHGQPRVPSCACATTAAGGPWSHRWEKISLLFF